MSIFTNRRLQIVNLILDSLMLILFVFVKCHDFPTLTKTWFLSTGYVECMFEKCFMCFQVSSFDIRAEHFWQIFCIQRATEVLGDQNSARKVSQNHQL